MKKFRRSLALVLLAMVIATVGASNVAVAVAGGEGGAASCPTDSLSVGQRLEVGTRCSILRSLHGRFVLYLDASGLTMDQNLDRTGEPSGDLSTQTGATWTEQALSGAGYRGLALVLRRSGSLVLVTPAGQVLWSTHTSNGRARTVVLRDNGRLVLLDGSGNRVWTSNSGIYALGGGDRVGPGEQLIGTINYFSGRGATLRNTSNSSTGTMQRDGDFVYRCSRDPRIVWHTNTHRAGSYMEMSQTGNLVIRGPLGRVLWSSHTAAWHHVFSSLGISVHNAQGDNWYAFNYPVGSSC